MPAAEQRDLAAPAAQVAQHARQQAQPVERRAVLDQGQAAARSALDMVEDIGGQTLHRAPRIIAERVQPGRYRRRRGVT